MLLVFLDAECADKSLDTARVLVDTNAVCFSTNPLRGALTVYMILDYPKDLSRL